MCKKVFDFFSYVYKKVRMVKRSLVSQIKKLALNRYKMVFISGPRQAGKTTIAKALISNNHYYNWDDLKFKKLWIGSRNQLAENILAEANPEIVFDEIHKNPKWKNQIKGFYDIYGDKIKIILTGSAKLNVFRRGADSLLGRFLHFHLNPFSLGELFNKKILSFNEWEKSIMLGKFSAFSGKEKDVDRLFKFGGFPEPYLTKSDEIHKLWSKNRTELLIRQDLRDISQFLQHNQIEVLASILPERVGSPISYSSLSEDLEVAHTTITRWMNALDLVYYHFLIRPYSNKIVRSLKKEGKIYLYDWSVIENLGHKFENMLAMHLKKIIDYYNDTGQANLSLAYIRNKEKEEIDFLVLHNNKPFFTVESKLNDLQLDKTFVKFQSVLKVPHFQIIKQSGILRKFQNLNATLISFDTFFHSLP